MGAIITNRISIEPADSGSPLRIPSRPQEPSTSTTQNLLRRSLRGTEPRHCRIESPQPPPFKNREVLVVPGSVAAASDQIDVASQRRPSPWTLRSAAFIALLITCLFLLRLPSALVPREFNVDESLLLSQAMKFAVDPRPWIAADVETSGPLNSYFVSGLPVAGNQTHIRARAHSGWTLLCARTYLWLI